MRYVELQADGTVVDRETKEPIDRGNSNVGSMSSIEVGLLKEYWRIFTGIFTGISREFHIKCMYL
jgi:hypothetical protein